MPCHRPLTMHRRAANPLCRPLRACSVMRARCRHRELTGLDGSSQALRGPTKDPRILAFAASHRKSPKKGIVNLSPLKRTTPNILEKPAKFSARRLRARRFRLWSVSDGEARRNGACTQLIREGISTVTACVANNNPQHDDCLPKTLGAVRPEAILFRH